MSHVLIVSNPDGSQPIAATVTGDREARWKQFRTHLAPHIHHPYGPQRLRLVPEEDWPAVRDALIPGGQL